MGFPKIERFIREEKHYPNKEVHIVEKTTVDEHNVPILYEASIGKDEAELYKYIKFKLSLKLSEKELDEVWDLVEAYGRECYNEGSEDCWEENAGADY